jgi:hypothetical protein
MSENIQWSPRPWTLKDFPQTLQSRLRKLQPNQPLLTDKINGDDLYVRRVGINRFQCGFVGARNLPAA